MAKNTKKEGVDLGVLEMSSPVTPLGIKDGTLVPMETGELKFWQARGKEVPFYATEYAAGFDLRADLEGGDEIAFYNHSNVKHTKTARASGFANPGERARLFIEPGERVLVPTGLYADIPGECYIAIHSRSGTSWKVGLVLTNGVGVIDADYVEEIKVSLTNISGTRVVIEDGERIAQGLLMPVTKAPISAINKKPAQKTSRAGGFGSTGVK